MLSQIKCISVSCFFLIYSLFIYAIESTVSDGLGWVCPQEHGMRFSVHHEGKKMSYAPPHRPWLIISVYQNIRKQSSGISLPACPPAVRHMTFPMNQSKTRKL